MSWKSKKQSTVALSTAEAEYVAASSAAQEAIWLRKLLTDLGHPPDRETILEEDNQSTIAMTRNPQFHGRAKHIDLKVHFIRERVESKELKLVYCPTDQMVADILTKGIPRQTLETLRPQTGLVERAK